MNAAFRRLTIALLIPLLTACGIAMDSAPRDVPVSERILPLGVDTSSFDTSGSSLIYLVAVGDDRLLRSVRRDSETQSELLESLLAGPTEDETVAQLSSSLPPDLEVLSTRTVGSVAYVDVSTEITELRGQALLNGAAQLVLTTVELVGVEAVQLTVAGERFPWPTTQGNTTSGLLRIFDFAGVFESAQPDFPSLPPAA
ncbi:MAG: GerMN domain-containing protein [Ilumatobacteraceae bacterium]|nr:GerMN domain-containing protein [Ilumatobacteraceae bacterium]